MTTLAIDEHEGLVRTEAAQRCRTNRVRTVIERRAREVEGRKLNRQGLVQFADADLLERGRRHNVDSNGRIESGTVGNACAQRDDSFELAISFRRCLFLGDRRCCDGCDDSCSGSRTQNSFKLHDNSPP